MKQILIFQENASTISIEDDDDSNIEEFTKKISSLLESNNVSLLHTSRASVVLRPNKITSVVVYDIDIENLLPDQSSKQKEPEKQESEDIISD
jgi:hypothetical protein